MQPERWEKVKEIFASALERDAAERSLFVDQACANDPELREEVRSLLSAHDDADDFISQPAAQRAGLVHEARSVDWIGQRLGYYRIVAEIGRGGMSQVYKAVRDDAQYEKEVAIKLLRPGLDTESLLRRFRAERQILAQLSHPHIAHLLDGGTTEQGSPYLVMEYIEGQPIDEYCTEHQLGLTKRLDLFRTLCLAVHYVHQHLMVHGDIKGSNVLVTQDGVVKLLDFGIAKLLNPAPALSLDEQRATGFVALTPEYASPEQVRGEAITTASDVYSLGVLLYRLLAGKLPYDVKGSTTWELATRICGHEPAPPSGVAAEQDGVHRSFAREIEGDLDNIVLKALKKLPQERYGSAEQLAQDIRSYLRGFPVQARPDTTRYRVKKFAQRHKAAAIAAGLFIVAMIAGIVATSWQAHVARVERERAERHFREVRELTNAYMSDVYDAVEKLPGATAVRRLLVENSLKYLSGLEREAQDSEELQRDLAYAYEKLGDVQGDYLGANLGDTEGAMKSYRHALALRAALVARNPTPEHKQELLRSHIGVSELLIAQSAVDESIEHAREGVRLGEELIARRGVTDLDRRYLAAAHVTLGWELGLTGQVDAGMQQLAKARALYKQILDANPNGMKARRDMALVHSRMGDVLLQGAHKPADALPLLEESSRIIEPLTVEFPSQSDMVRLSAFILLTRAEAENALGRPQDALDKTMIAVHRLEILQRADQVNEQASLAIAYALGDLSDSYALLGDHGSALKHLNRAAIILRRSPSAKPTDISEIRLLGAATYVRLAKVHAAMAAQGQRILHAQEARQWATRALASLTPLEKDALIGKRARELRSEVEAVVGKL